VCARGADRALLGSPSTSPLEALYDPNGHVISSLGVAVRVNWAWLFRVRQTAEDGSATGLRRCPNDLPVFRFKHYAARHSGSDAYCYSILCQNVTARLTIVVAGRDAGVVLRRGRGETVCARGAWQALLGGPSTSPLDRSAGRGTYSATPQGSTGRAGT
jgi:hypothetical protein